MGVVHTTNERWHEPHPPFVLWPSQKPNDDGTQHRCADTIGDAFGGAVLNDYRDGDGAQGGWQGGLRGADALQAHLPEEAGR